MVLEKIVANKAIEVAQRKERCSLEEITQGLTRSDRSLAKALSKPGTGYILECKKASPSRGLIRPDFDPAEIASTYHPFADAISVITDAQFFMGELEYVQIVRSQVTAPVLLKDFVIDPYQVSEARFYGADAVLLMLSVLDDATYGACRDAADSLGLDVLTEVHDEHELERALRLDAQIIGINNRNLKTLSVDLAQTRALAPLVPGDRLLVCESGIHSHADVVALRAMVDGFLVGTSLMGQSDISKACRALIYGSVKVCGLTRPEDAIAAARAGATYGGVIFAPKSPRCVSVDQARAVRSAADLKWVGVFVNEHPETVASIARELDLDSVQLHGDEDKAYIAALRKIRHEDCGIWKAVRVSDKLPALDFENIDRVVLDTFSPRARGGTGERFDWSLLRGQDLSRVVLGGGLSPENAAAADALNPAVLDVNSGVEETPGIKSAERLGVFFNALRGTSRSGK